jgi:hypothetical protein
MSAAIYVISDPVYADLNLYKIGSHTGTQSKLISRYITALPKMFISYYTETQAAYAVETIVKNSFIDCRIKNRNGNLSEWYNMFILDIISNINTIVQYVESTFKNIDNNIISAKSVREVNALDFWKCLCKGEWKTSSLNFIISRETYGLDYYYIPKQQLYMLYKQWCIDTGHYYTNIDWFYRDLKSNQIKIEQKEHKRIVCLIIRKELIDTIFPYN